MPRFRGPEHGHLLAEAGPFSAEGFEAHHLALNHVLGQVCLFPARHPERPRRRTSLLAVPDPPEEHPHSKEEQRDKNFRENFDFGFGAWGQNLARPNLMTDLSGFRVSSARATRGGPPFSAAFWLSLAFLRRNFDS